MVSRELAWIRFASLDGVVDSPGSEAEGTDTVDGSPEHRSHPEAFSLKGEELAETTAQMSGDGRCLADP